MVCRERVIFLNELDQERVLTVARESADAFPPLKSALGGLVALMNEVDVSIKACFLM